jgi:hypothetical protein
MQVKPYYATHFQGYGTCNACHSEPLTAWNASYANTNIVLDGLEDDPFWGGPNQFNTLYVPISPLGGGEFEFFKMRWSQNLTHLFIMARVVDNTVEGSDVLVNSVSDMAAIMFNINQTGGFNEGEFWNGMALDQPNSYVDMVTWKPTAAEDGNHNETKDGVVTGKVWDEYYSSNGRGQDTNNWSWAAHRSYARGHWYQYLEMARPLDTGEDTDVDFKYDGYYSFGVAHWNNSVAANHAISFEHAVWIHGTDGADPTGISATNYIDETVTFPVYEATEYVTETKTEWDFETETVEEKETVIVVGDEITVTNVEEVTSAKSDAPINLLFAFFGIVCIGAVFYRRRR